jgi:hypothetical protein
MCETEYYYPRIPVLEQLAQAPAGRFLGVGCLPPRVVEHLGLRDIRGYDAVDPAGIVELLDLARNENYSGTEYARTQWYVPKFFEDSEGYMRIPGVLNQLNLRYLIFAKPLRGNVTPFLSGDGYWIYANNDALPRPFVPTNVTNDLSGVRLMEVMAQREFNAIEHSYAETKTDYVDCRGRVQITREHSQEIVLDVYMETPGLVVLSDLWYSGWEAEMNGETVPIVRANHSLRGVEVPTGHSTIVMTYRPSALKWGLRISCVGVGVCVVWGILVAWRTLTNR